MDKEKIVELVIAEVLNRLKSTELIGSAQEVSPIYSGLVIFTGGAIGLETAFEELRSIQALRVGLTVVFTAAAEKVIGVNRVKKELGAHIKIVTSQDPYPRTELQEAHGLIIPVLSQNTAAKLACLISDNIACTLILQALMMGKPVIAAMDAADPDNIVRRQKNMNQPAPALREALLTNLEKIKSYGASLITADKLASQTKKVLLGEEKTIQPRVKTEHDNLNGNVNGNVKGNGNKRKVLDAEAVKNSINSGVKTIHVAKATVITPLAWDTARDLQAVIVRDM